MLMRVHFHRGGKRKPGFAILSMNDQRGRSILLAIHKKDDHLTIAISGSMVRAGTVGVSQTGYMQIERLHNTETGIG